MLECCISSSSISAGKTSKEHSRKLVYIIFVFQMCGSTWVVLDKEVSTQAPELLEERLGR